MKPFTFRKNKVMVGKKAKEFLAIAKHRPELSNSYTHGPFYELPDGQIVQVAIIWEKPDGFIDEPTDYPKVTPYCTYVDEQELNEIVQRIKNDMEEEGRLPVPYPEQRYLNKILSGKEVADFLEDHDKLEAGAFDYTPNFSADYFKNQAGEILMVASEVQNDEPQMRIVLAYSSEANAREWQAYWQSELPQVRPAQPQPTGWEPRFATLNEAETNAFLATHEYLGNGLFKLSGFTEYFKGSDGKLHAAAWFKMGYSGMHSEIPPGTRLILGNVYESEQNARDWERYLREWNRLQQKPRDHMLYRYTRDEPNWPAHLETWRSFLAEYLAIPIEQLDFSLKSCRLLDRHRKAQKVDSRTYEKLLFGPCLGYLYEVVRRHWNGEWSMQASDWAPMVYEPYIRRPDGVEIRLFVNYWEDAAENYRRLSLYNLAQDAMQPDYPAFML